MSNSRQSGMTLIELVVAIVIISAGLAGVLTAFTTTVRASADPMVAKQMSAIAEGMMEEILLKPFAAPGAAPAGCARATLTNAGAFNGYSTTDVCDIDGNPVTGLADYGVSVTVTQPATSPITGVPADQVLVVTVNVTYGSNTYSLTGWRTNFAGP